MSRQPVSFWPARAIFLGKGLTVAALLSVTVCSLGRLVVHPSVTAWAAARRASVEAGTTESGTTNQRSYRRISFTQTATEQTATEQALKGDGKSERAVVPQASAAIAASNERTATQNYQQAMDLANQAVVAYQSARSAREAGNLPRSLDFTRQERSLWQDTLQKLATIPKDSALYEQSIAKHTQYQPLLITAEGKIHSTEDDFLLKAIQDANVSTKRVHITLCQIAPLTPASLDSTPPATAQAAKTSPGSEGLLYNGYLNPNRCRHHLGSQPMASPASLIKVPIAMVLMHKVTTEDIDLDEDLFIDPDNFTENAEGARIDVGETYPLREVMAQMINQSDNIATNQLIDYLGRDYLANTLTQKGYLNTWAGHKLAGDWIMPKDAGSRANQSTTNELTAMLAQIYSLNTPGDEELLSALVSQSDRELGHEALKDIAPSVHWIGEKTGQNNQVIATSLAMKIEEERYALTVAIDHSADLYAVHNIIRSVANHLLETGALVESPEGLVESPEG